jgi:hypothetical protein
MHGQEPRAPQPRSPAASAPPPRSATYSTPPRPRARPGPPARRRRDRRRADDHRARPGRGRRVEVANEVQLGIEVVGADRRPRRATRAPAADPAIPRCPHEHRGIGPRPSAPIHGSSGSCAYVSTRRRLPDNVSSTSLGFKAVHVTTLFSWTSVDARGPSALYIASDSRISWITATGHPTGRWDIGRKLFAPRISADAFGFSGDVLFPSILLGQICSLIDASVLFSASDGPLQRAEIIKALLVRGLDAYPEQQRRDFSVFYGTRTGERPIPYRAGTVRPVVPISSLHRSVERGCRLDAFGKPPTNHIGHYGCRRKWEGFPDGACQEMGHFGRGQNESGRIQCLL